MRSISIKRGNFYFIKSEDKNKKVKVLLNGDTVAAFTSNIIKLYVKDGDVVRLILLWQIMQK